MQNTTVMAFRKRLKKRGYSDVSIIKMKDNENYMVSAVEPLARTIIRCEYSLSGMYHSMKF